MGAAGDHCPGCFLAELVLSVAKEVNIGMVNLCLLADWKTHLVIADETILTVRADGEVVCMHNGIEIKFGHLTKAQLAAVSAWYGKRPRRKRGAS